MTPDADLILAKRGDGFGLDVGEPRFLQQVMEPVYRIAFSAANYRSHKQVTYPPLGGDDALKDLIRSYMFKLHPELPPPQHVVVTCGARHALQAAIQASKAPHTRAVFHKAPYWPSMPTMVELMGLEFTTKPELAQLHVYTSPGNPDGSLSNLGFIHDAAYCHPTLYNGNAPRSPVSTWSAAKLFGLSGLRIGWLLTDYDVVAKQAAIFVEKSTSGVSRQSQDVLKEVLRWALRAEADKTFRAARDVLETNIAAFRRYFEPYVDKSHGAPEHGAGLFAWFKPREMPRFAEALRRADVSLISGSICGATDEWYRLNLGAEPLKLLRAAQAVRRAMRTL